MRSMKRVMERGQPPTAAPYATTPRGYPFPLDSWPPDAASDIQNLAQAIDADITGTPTAAVNFAIGSVPSGISDLKGGSPTLTGGITYNSSTGFFTLPKLGTYLFTCTVGLSGTVAVQALLYQDAGLVGEGTTAPSSANPRSTLAVGVYRAAGSNMKFAVSAGAASTTVVATATIALLA